MLVILLGFTGRSGWVEAVEWCLFDWERMVAARSSTFFQRKREYYLELLSLEKRRINSKCRGSGENLLIFRAAWVVDFDFLQISGLRRETGAGKKYGQLEEKRYLTFHNIQSYLAKICRDHVEICCIWKWLFTKLSMKQTEITNSI